MKRAVTVSPPEKERSLMESVFRFLSHVFKLLLLLTVPAMAISPSSELPVSCLHLPINDAPQFLNYDDILDLIVAIDEDELDDKCTPEQIEKIAYFLSFLAKNGVGPDDPISCASLNQDIDTLLCGIQNDVRFLSPYTAYSLEPAVYYEHPDTLLCKKWMSKQFHAVKKFVKKHKTAIIIGGAVVVGITLGVIAVAAFAGKTAACSAAATAVGAAASGLASDEQGDRPPISSQPTYQEIAKQPIDLIENIEQALPIFESPALTQVIQEKSNSLKATFAEEVLAEQLSPNASPSWSMAEKARQLGSAVAHEVLDGVATLGSVVPELQAEIIDVASKIVPQNYIPADLPEMINTDPVGSYNDIVLALHEGIDEVFSTNGAGRYTPEAKAKDPLNDFAIGIVPPPVGGFSGKKGWELKNPKYQSTRNAVTDIDGRLYRGHALDQMQNRGVPPSVVEQTIQNGKIVNVDQNLGTVDYYDPINKIKVILNEKDEVVTVIRVNEG